MRQSTAAGDRNTAATLGCWNDRWIHSHSESESESEPEYIYIYIDISLWYIFCWSTESSHRKAWVRGGAAEGSGGGGAAEGTRGAAEGPPFVVSRFCKRILKNKHTKQQNNTHLCF